MLFNSIQFALFLPIVFGLYWFVLNKQLKVQNALLLLASYFFYACWDWRFVFLLLFSTFLDFFTGQKIAESLGKKKVWLWISIVINLGFLGVFKYFNFFAESFTAAASQVGVVLHPWTVDVILPVGISFYTFHGLSYVIDLYYDRIKPEKDFVDYAVFVSFFPLLVAGPIERATHLLPQIKQSRVFNYDQASNGLRQILWGLFKKMVIADGCAEYANTIFNHSGQQSGSTLVVGALLFAFQIYGDFSGYSDIAIGTARLFGIELLKNFSFPYFSRDIAEFWRRWHISLSSWFRDYLYIPLGGSKGGKWMRVRNTFIIFVVSGFWHGANWTFICWGALNAVYFLPLLLNDKNRVHLNVVAQGKVLPGVKDFLRMLLTFSLTVFAWIFFRADSLAQAMDIVHRILSASVFTVPSILPGQLFVLLLLFVVIEWLGREGEYALAGFGRQWSKPVRYAFYYALILAIVLFSGKEQQFIYFQF